MACEYRVKGSDVKLDEAQMKTMLHEGLLDHLMIDNNISIPGIKPAQEIASSYKTKTPTSISEEQVLGTKEPQVKETKEPVPAERKFVNTDANIRGMKSSNYQISVSDDGKTAIVKMPNKKETSPLPVKEMSSGRKYVVGPNGASVYLPTETKATKETTTKEKVAQETEPIQEKKTRRQPIKGIDESSSPKAKELEGKLRFSPNEFTGNETPEEAGLVDVLETFDKETGKKTLKNKPMRAIIRDAAYKGEITSKEEEILQNALEDRRALYDKAKANPKAQKVKVELAEKIRSGKLGKNVAGLNAALFDAVIELAAKLVESGMDSYMALSKAINNILGKEVEEGRMSQEDFDKTKSEVLASEGSKAGIKKSSIPKEAENNARQALSSKSNAEVIQAGKDAVESGLVNPEELVKRVIEGGNASLTATETAALVYHKAKLNNDLSNATTELVEDLSSGGNNETDLRIKIADLEKKILDFYSAAVRTGVEWSAAGRMRQMLMNENYDALFQINKYKSNNDGEISPELEKKMKEWSAEIERLNKIIEEKEAQIEKNIGNEAIENITSESDKIKKGKSKGPKFSTSQDGKVKVPNSIIREYVESGIRDIDALVDAVRERISDVYPNATTRQVRDAITGYGRTINMSQDEISMAIQEMKSIGRMISKLEDLQQEIKNKKNKKKKRSLSEMEKELKDEIKRKLNSMPLTDEEISEKEEERLESYKKRVETSIRELKYKLDNGDFTKKPKPNPLKLDEEASILRGEREMLKEKFDLEHERLERKNRHWSDKFIIDPFMEVFNTPKALLATADLSAPLRQGILPLSTMFFTNPKKAYSLLKQMIKFAGKSEDYFNAYMAKIKASPEYLLMKEAGLYLAEPNAKLTAKEEGFQSNWAKHLPIYGKAVRINGKRVVPGLDVVGRSERAYTGFLNELRVEMFMSGMAKMKDAGVTINSSPENVKAWAKYVNNATGRGTGARAFEMAAPALAIPLFSPRLIAARFNTLFNPAFYARMPKQARNMALKQTAGFLSVAAMSVILAKLMDDEDDDNYSLSLDPRSTDFAKIKYGNTRIDFLGGYQQYARFFTQFITGEKVKEDGTVYKLGSKYGDATRGSISGDFLEKKLSPGAKIIWDWATITEGSREYKEEQEKTFLDKVKEMTLPIWIQDVPDLYEEHGATGATGLSLLSIFGMGVQQQEPHKPSSKSRSKKSGVGSTGLDTGLNTGLSNTGL